MTMTLIQTMTCLMINKIEQDIAALARSHSETLIKYDMYLGQQTDLANEIKELEHEEKILILVDQALLSLSAELTRQTTQEIETLLNTSLQTIFYDLDLRVEIEVVQVRGSTGLKINIFENGNPIGSLRDAQAGGVLVTISCLLRIICIVLSGSRRILILDEVFSHVSEEYLETLGSVLREIAESLDFTIVLVTHKQALKEHAHTHYHLDTTFKKMKG